MCADFGGFGQDPTTLTRRQTLAEGLLAGLQPMATLPATQVDNKMKLLVEVPAAVEEALASLAIADSSDSNIGAPSSANLRVPSLMSLLVCCLHCPHPFGGAGLRSVLWLWVPLQGCFQRGEHMC